MHDLLKTWDALGSPRLLVLGDLILDRYTWGDAERVSPEAPVLVLRADAHEARLGGAASVAGLLRALDAEVVLAGVVGDDASGRVLRQLLAEAGIDDRLVLCDAQRPTTTKERFIGRAAGRHPHQILRVDEEVCDPLGGDLPQQLADGILARLPEFQAVLISDYAKGVCRTGANGETPIDGTRPAAANPRSDLLQTVIRAAANCGIPVIVDPARGSDCSGYRGATVLKPNRIEAELASGVPIGSAQDAIRAGDRLCARLGVPAVVITLDREGMVLCQPGQPGELFPTRPRAVYDITGAGDMALALFGLALAYATNPAPRNFYAALPVAVRLANVAAGLEVERLGVSPITRREIRGELLAERDAEGGKIVTLDEMVSLAARYRQRGKTIVFTNGCFDLLHVGHLACLRQAARRGDVLVVAINSDDSVRQLKGPGRPVIPAGDRAALVAALDCVDHVLIFSEPTPHALLRRIRPDLLVKGGTTQEIVGRELVESYGGQVGRTDPFGDVSTTQLIGRTLAGKPGGAGVLPANAVENQA